MRRHRDRWHAGTTTLMIGALCLASLGACGGDEPVVGSGEVTETTLDAMFVERVRISMPFRSVVYNGEPRFVRLRGEDNLLALIAVEEVAVGQWEITAPPDLEFEQHADVEVEIPFIEMVEITISGDHIELGDNPIHVWRETGDEAAEE